MKPSSPAPLNPEGIAYTLNHQCLNLKPKFKPHPKIPPFLQPSKLLNAKPTLYRSAPKPNTFGTRSPFSRFLFATALRPGITRIWGEGLRALNPKRQGFKEFRTGRLPSLVLRVRVSTSSYAGGRGVTGELYRR